MDWLAKLKEMESGYGAKINALEGQVGAVVTQSTDLKEQIDALDTANGFNKSSAGNILNDKAAVFETKLGGVVSVHVGANFGKTNLTDWYLYWHGDVSTTPVTPGKIVYRYGSIGWDGNPTLTCLFNEFDFFNDYINDPLTVNIAGLRDLLNLLDQAQTTLENAIATYNTAKRRLKGWINSGISGCLLNPTGGDLDW